jgi:hypothetical protein
VGRKSSSTALERVTVRGALQGLGVRLVADYNNDGWPDLYITCWGGSVLYRNNGDGTFTDVTAKGRCRRRPKLDGRGFR